MPRVEANLATRHEQYPDGFPARNDDRLLAHWKTPQGVVVVEEHPHGYEIHFYPCYDFDRCDACSPDRGPSNPHTSDGHHFRFCGKRGHVLTVAGGDVGEAAVLQYLAMEGSEPHVEAFARRVEREERADADLRAEEAEENERQLARQRALEPSPEERMAALQSEMTALESEMTALRETIQNREER